MAEYKTPGVYVEEISKFPPSVAGVATAIPAFIGFTAKCPSNQKGKPVKVTSMVDYEAKFGGAPTLKIEGDKLKNNEFVMYDSMRLFYDNGGGTCYVCSVGSYDQDASSGEDNVASPTAETYLGSKKELVSELEKVDEVTLVLFPDAALVLGKDALGEVHKAALNHCGKMGDRFAILDVKDVEDPNDKLGKTLSEFRSAVGTSNLSYGAAYYPYLKTTYTKEIGFDEMCNDTGIGALVQANSAYAQYNSSEIPGEKEIIAKAIISQIPEYAGKLAQYQAKAQVIPPSAAIAGIYAMTDANKDSFGSIIQRIITKQTNIGRGGGSSLSYLISELLDNIYEHSHSKNGYVFSQYLEHEGMIDLCIADTGVTIFNSFKTCLHF